jgi:octanoyl-[GcvH]:protein N-octanoyltransferase
MDPIRGEVDLLRGPLEGEPALEIALASTLLSAVAAGAQGPVLRVYGPPPTVAFGRRDAFLPGFPRAAAAARQRGFEPVLRAQGGRAAAYDGGCLVLDEIMPSRDSMIGIHERFAQDAERHARALRGLGVDARVGEVPGEYCPGPFTVNARGERKLIGSAQRLKRGGWLLSTVVVVDGAGRLREVLEDVYAALELDWDPATVGAVIDEAPGQTVETVQAALLASYAERYRLRPAALTLAQLAAAATDIDRHRASPQP